MLNLTQSQLNTEIDTAISRYSGKQVAYKNGYRGECLSLNKQIWDDILHVAMPPTGIGFADGYFSNYEKLQVLKDNFIKGTFDPKRNYPKGTQVIYAKTHHITTYLQNNHNGTHKVFEQNADPDGSAAHIADRADSKATGVLIPRVKAESVLGSKVSSIFLPAKSPRTGKPLADWSVYPVNTPLPVRRANRRGWVNPSNPKYGGGLTYKILATVAPSTYKIHSNLYGDVLIYNDGDATIN